MMWLRAGSRFDRRWCLWWAAEYLNTSLIILSGAHELMPEETSSLCSKLYVVPIFYSVFFLSNMYIFQANFHWKKHQSWRAAWLELKQHLQGADKRNVPCCLRCWIIIFYKTLLFKTGFHPNTCLAKAEANNRHDRVQWKKKQRQH